MKFSKFLCIVCCLCLLALLPSCKEPLPKQNEETTALSTKQVAGYQAFLVGGASDSAGDVANSSEYDLWPIEEQNPHQDASAPREYTVLFDGKEYTGTYSRTELSAPRTYKVHKYFNFDERCSFSVHAQTGELMYINLPTSLIKPYPVDKEKCAESAKSYAARYIDLNTYQTEEIIYDEGGEYFYSLRFYREIGGYRTNDILRISVNGSGEIVTMEQSMLGSFDGVTDFPIDEQSASATLESKINETFQGNTDYKGSEVSFVRLIRLPDGTCALFYILQNEFDSSAVHSHETFSQYLVVPVYEEVTE